MVCQIASNHILSFDTFCFCLLCKKSLYDNICLNSEKIICAHLVSEEHESNFKELFKFCFPDPSCESEDVKYVNILRNLAFDVSWEISNEGSYVCKSDNSLKCLICETNISSTFKDKKKLELQLASHLKSQSHLNKLKSKVTWIHHPNEDTNYIAFHKFFVFCSYCQKYLKSPTNTLLQVAAAHVTKDLEKINQVKAIEEQRDKLVEDLCLLFDFLSVTDENEQQFQRSDEGIVRDCSHFSSRNFVQTEIEDLNNIQLKEVLDTEKDIILPTYGIKHNEASSSREENTKELQVIGVENCTSNLQGILNQVVLSDWINENSLLRLNEQYIEIKDNRLFCKMCKMFIKFDENIYSLKNHLFKDHNDLLVQRATEFISTKKNKSANSIIDTSIESDKFCLVVRAIARDKKFMSHLRFIENNGENFVCTLCKTTITFTTCGKYVEIHFFQTDHLKKAYEISVTSAFVKEMNQKSKTNRKKRKSKPQIDKTHELFFNNTNGLKLPPAPIINQAKKSNNNFNESSRQDSQVSVTERRLLKILRLSSEENKEIKINVHFLSIQDEGIFCAACESLIPCVTSKMPLLKHCISEKHNQVLIKNATDFLVSNTLKLDCIKHERSEIIHKFYELVNEITENDPYDVTFSHLLFLIITNDNFSASPLCITCRLCNESIEFSVCGVENHFFSNPHRNKTYELNCKRLTDSGSKTFSEQPDGCKALEPVNLKYKIYKTRDKLDQSTSRINNSIPQNKKTFSEQPDGCKALEPVNLKYKIYKTRDKLDQSTSRINNSIPQNKNTSSEFENVFHKVLETAEHGLQLVVERNKQYVEITNKSVLCYICKVVLSKKTLNAGRLQSIATHFNGKTHKNQSKLAFEEKSSVKNYQCYPNPVVQTVNETSGSSNLEGQNSESQDPDNLLQHSLHRAAKKCMELRMNEVFISFTTNNFFCNICQEVQIFSDNCYFLKLHCVSDSHNDILLNNALTYVSKLKNDLTYSSEEDKIILHKMLTDISKKNPFNLPVIKPHVKFLKVKNKQIFCLLCREQIETSAKVRNHFQSDFHRVKVYALNCSSYTTSMVNSELNILTQQMSPVTNVAAVKKPSDECATDGLKPQIKQAPNSVPKVCEESNPNNISLLELILKNLPDDLREHGNMIEVSKETPYCKACRFEFPSNCSLSNVLKTIQQHLPEHIFHGQTSAKIELLFVTQAFESVSTKRQENIKTNIDYLEMRGNDLYCCICKINICTKKGVKFKNLNPIESHLNGKKHKKKM